MEINRGGKREGAGRPKKVDEELANTRIAKSPKITIQTRRKRR